MVDGRKRPLPRNRVGGGLTAPVLPHHRTDSAYPAVSSTDSTDATTRQGSFLFRRRGPLLLLVRPSSGSAFTRDAGAHGLLPPFKGRVGRPCLAAALCPSSPPDWLLAVEDSALHPSRTGRTNMASADFSGAFPHRCRCGSPDGIGTAPEISQGKPCILPSVPAGFTNAHVRMTIGPPRPWPGYPTAPALYPVPVRRVRVLPSASFRFHLAGHPCLG